MALSKFQIISICCGTGAVIIAIIVGVIPFVMESNLKSSLQEKTNPTIDNTDYWAKFPGKLNTSLIHSFKFISSDENSAQLTDAETVYEERVFYDDIKKEKEQISFNNKREYVKKSSKEGTVKTISLGMLEMFNTLSNPPLYKEAISSMMYLINYSFGTSEDFIRKLFTFNAYKTIVQVPEKLNEMLKDIADEEKKTQIKENEVYGLSKSISNFYKWTSILENEELIKKAVWLTDVLKLTEEEKLNLLGVNSMLSTDLKAYNDELVTKFTCPQSPCGNELMYHQLIDQTVTAYIGKANIKEMLIELDSKSYPFNDPFEMKYYYDTMKKTDYSKDKLSIDQLKSMFDATSQHVLFEPSNSIALLNLNQTQDLSTAELKYKIKTKEQLSFVIEYIYTFLLDNFLYSSFKSGDATYKIDALTKTYTSLMSLSVDQTYGVLMKNENLYSLILTKIVSNYMIKRDPDPNMCPILLQRVIGDGRRVLQICSHEKLGMKDEKSIQPWVKTFICIRNNCQTEMKDYIKKIVPLSDDELKRIFSDDSIGKYINEADAKARDHYKCGDRCSEEYLARKQYVSCEITLNPPEEIPKAKSISDWDKIDFPYPIELKYYQDEEKCSDEDCNSDSNEVFLGLYGINGESINKKSAQGVYHRNLFEKIYTLILNNKEDPELNKQIYVKTAKNYFAVITKVITLGMLENTAITEYSTNSILLGNDSEDKAFIELLKSGSVYDYYNPKGSQTTGFAIGSKDEIKTDKIVIDALQSNNKTLRAIKQMNNEPFLSINQKVYSAMKNEMVDIISPIFSNYTFNESQWASDGFQYSGDLSTIYYYDELSSRILEFNYDSSKAYQNMTCYNYILNNDLYPSIREKRDIKKEGFGEAAQKFNKPFIVSSTDSVNVTNLNKQESFICVDPFSNMVLESNISLIYSVYTKNFNYLNSKLANDKIYPLILYNRNYSIDSVSYSMNFEGLSGYNTGRLLLIIFGIIFIALLVGLCVFFWYKHVKSQGDELEKSSDNIHDVLVPKSFDDNVNN